MQQRTTLLRLCAVAAGLAVAAGQAVDSTWDCDRAKAATSCIGVTTGSGVCEWTAWGCRVGAPRPPDTVPVADQVPVPDLVCPVGVGEATCVEEPCLAYQCPGSPTARCVPNACDGEVEYLGNLYNQPCSAIFVSDTAVPILCNVAARGPGIAEAMASGTDDRVSLPPAADAPTSAPLVEEAATATLPTPTTTTTSTTPAAVADAPAPAPAPAASIPILGASG